MRTGCIAIVLLLSAIAHGAEPTTRPTVLLTRFAQLSETAGTEWIGRAVQESLLTDISRGETFRIVSDQHPPTTDLTTARQLGRDARADFVVIGGYQAIGADLKITGQIVDVSNGDIAGTLKANATANELIAMEDSLGGQLVRTLNRKRPGDALVDDKKIELQTLGPVRMANFSRPFLKSTNDPNSYYTNRHTYGLPAYSPYFDCGYGYGCGYYGYGFGYSFGGFNPVSVTPRDGLPW